MQTTRNSQDHLQAVQEWLSRNIRTYPTPQSLTLTGFELNEKDFSGKATLLLDENSEEIYVRMDETGRMTYSLPMFHSPLGAPASYGAVSLTGETQKALGRMVESLLPRFLPLGLHPVTKSWITTSTPLHERALNKADLDEAVRHLKLPSFKLVLKLSELSNVPITN